MTKLPIAVCLFTSTKGHFGAHTTNDTLNHLNRQIPLSTFGALYAHVKVDPDKLALGDEIVANLRARGFTVEQTIGSWSRGTSHGQAYLGDMAKASQSPVVQSQPFMLLAEDDSTLNPNACDLLTLLSRMTNMLESNHDLVSTRLIRRTDWDGGVPIIRADKDIWYSDNFDFQPAILRSRDYLIANKVIQDNWAQLSHLQCELVMRIALDTLSRAKERHAVFLPDYAETYHLGTPDYLKTKALLNL